MLPLMLLMPFAPEPSVKGLFQKVGPGEANSGRSRGQARAVVLIHGLALHPFFVDRVITPHLRTWQEPGSGLVKALGKRADVYSFAYGQTAAAEKVAEASGLQTHVKKLKDQGYTEIVLIGHSAGGLIARHLVEDHPDCGVTRAVQVCAPNRGCMLAAIRAVRSAQADFLGSLTRTARERVLHSRAEKKLPAGVEFACVVASLRMGSDGVVGLSSQWSEDLQNQGVPAFLVHVGHRDVLMKPKGIEAIVEASTAPTPRWTAEKVASFRKTTFGR